MISNVPFQILPLSDVLAQRVRIPVQIGQFSLSETILFRKGKLRGNPIGKMDYPGHKPEPEKAGNDMEGETRLYSNIERDGIKYWYVKS